MSETCQLQTCSMRSAKNRWRRDAERSHAYGVTASAAGRVGLARGPGSRVRNLRRVYTEMGSMQSTSTRKGMTNGSFSVGKLIAIAFNAS